MTDHSHSDDPKPGTKSTIPPAEGMAGKPQPPGGAKKAKGPAGAGKAAGPKSVRPAKPPTKPVKPPARKAMRPQPPGGSHVVVPAGDGQSTALPVLTRKDFTSDADVRWCPGCGDYAILAAVQRTLPELTERKENVVFVSGIGCSSRFPYYMETFGFHTIHGRAPTVATGLKASRPDLDVWIITGDGDGLSIGGNHFAHLMRRNLGCQILLFNNQIYGLTKGQYSPTSERGKVTKSTPYGSIDHPFNPPAFALGAGATFVCRTLDRDAKHMQAALREAHGHDGTGFVEIYQNCNIFNDGAFFAYTERDRKPLNALFLEDGEPMVFDNGKRGLRLDGLRLEAVDMEEGASTADLLVHDPRDKALAAILIDQTFRDESLPRPFGVIYQEGRPTYDRLLNEQVEAVTNTKGSGDLRALLYAADTWEIAVRDE